MSPVHPGSSLGHAASASSLAIDRVEAFVFRWPVRTPVRTSFGTMLDRPAVLVRVTDRDGAFGWGEAWCNFPACGAEHRARLVETVLAPLLVGATFDAPAAAFAALSQQTAVLALQSGEPGPLAQAIAAVDVACHDLVARRAGVPLWRWLARKEASVPNASVAVYASGINPDRPGGVVEALRRAGHVAFKLKVGFGEARDLANVADVRAAAGAEARVMADANQSWTLELAERMAGKLGRFALGWLEEPLRADRPWTEWQHLAVTAPMPLAAGENMIGSDAFDAMIASRAVAVIQPDPAKWGGITGTLDLIDRIAAAGLRFLPALSRRRRRPAGVGPSARGERPARRPARSRRQREPAAHIAVPAAGNACRGANPAGRSPRPRRGPRSCGATRRLRRKRRAVVTVWRVRRLG